MTSAHSSGGDLAAIGGEQSNELRGRDEVAFVLAALWVTVGVYVDGFAHSTLSTPETFFTPWHGVLYSGIAAANAWLGFLIWRNIRRGIGGLRAIPRGYGLSVIGGLLFPLAGLFDLLWHTAFGIEVSIGALLSPSHLLLFSAGLLMFSGPLRSAWGKSDLPRRPTFAQAFPALMAVTILTAAVGFFLHYLSAFALDVPTTVADPSIADMGEGRFYAVVAGIASVLVTNLLLVAAVLFILSRFIPPFGSVALLVGFVALLMVGEHGFEHGPAGLIGAVAGALVGDLLVARLRPSPDRPVAWWLMATLFPLALWSCFFLALELASGLVWSAELWGGVIFLASLSGLALSLLMVSSTRELSQRPAIGT